MGRDRDQIIEEICEWLRNRTPSQVLSGYEKNFDDAPIYEWTKRHNAEVARARMLAARKARKYRYGRKKPPVSTVRAGDVARLSPIRRGNSYSDPSAVNQLRTFSNDVDSIR